MYHGNLAASLVSGMVPGRPSLVWNIRHSLYGLGYEKPMTRQVIRANRFLSGRPDQIMYNSGISREQHEAFGFRPERGKVIPNGFAMDRLGPSERTSQVVRGEFGIPKAALVVGHVARLHPLKDHDGFVRAAVRVGSQLQDVHFILCGKDVLPDNSALVELVPSGLRNKFHWLGERDDVPELMSAMDVLCQSSSWGEAFPNVLGEAMATSVPCVATDVGDSAAIVDDTGLIVDPRDEVALASALVRMLEMPAHERAALGARARVRVAERYSLDAVVQQYSAVYEGLARSSIDVN
jgi:glycosyltransferase involved in cell wall biosynthesis